jgi:3-oxosteroid 1-dehydrogenase
MSDPLRWDGEAAIIVVGSGAAGCAAAATSAANEHDVIMLEARAVAGGTTAISGGEYWIPNNHAMRRAGLADDRDEALAYMARVSFPGSFDAGAPNHGLARGDWEMLGAFYDHAAPAIEFFDRIGALRSAMSPVKGDYFAVLQEPRVVHGRVMNPRGTGAHLIGQFLRYLKRKRFQLLLEHRVRGLAFGESGEILGVLADSPVGRRAFAARKAVIFGSGGFVHDAKMRERFLQGPVFGTCGAPSNKGDFLVLAAGLGAQLGNMSSAWWQQIAIEREEDPNDRFKHPCFSPAGDSMVMVDRRGDRVCSEYAVYHSRGQIHHWVDPITGQYPNKLLFLVFDARVAERWAAIYQMAKDAPVPRALVEVDRLEDLAPALARRVAGLRPIAGSFDLDPGFTAGLTRTIERFNGFAASGEDLDFRRGELEIERWWYTFLATGAFDIPSPIPRAADGKPNLTMHPIAAKGPYYGMILAPGAMDTNGGPRTNASGQVLRWDQTPIAGIYGAGNCVSSLVHKGYWSFGSSIGPALAFGHVAALHAIEQPRREVGPGPASITLRDDSAD